MVEQLDLNFFGLTDDIFVFSVYWPPYMSKTHVSESNKDRINCFITFRDQLSYFSKKGKIILCGDFNARLLETWIILQKMFLGFLIVD